MAIPVVTCSADIVLNYAVGTQSPSLACTATEGATTFVWTILDVPVGSTALSETRGDFVNGVASIQNPGFLTDAGIEGTYIIQCIATGPTGSSVPAIDKQSSQQNIKVKTQSLELVLSGDYQYDWGKDNTQNLKTLENNISNLTVPLQLPEEVSDPVPVSGYGRLYPKDINSIVELFYRDDIGSIVQITENGVVKLSPITKPAQGIWQSGTTVDFTARPGQSSIVSLILQDGKRYSFSNTLNWDHNNSVNLLGYDEAASEAAGDKWIYFYGVPGTGSSLSVIASDNPISVGPAGYANYIMLYKSYRIAGSLLEIRQRGNIMWYFTHIDIALSEGWGTLAQSPEITFSMAPYVPEGAIATQLILRIGCNAAGAQFIIAVRETGSSSAAIFDRTLNTPVAHEVTEDGYCPLTPARSIKYLSRKDIGPGAMSVQNLWIKNWTDGDIEP